MADIYPLVSSVIVLLGVGSGLAVDKLPAPPKSDQDQIRSRLRDVFKAECVKTASAAKVAACCTSLPAGTSGRLPSTRTRGWGDLARDECPVHRGAIPDDDLPLV